MKKRFFAFLLAVVMVVGMMPTAAFAATSGICGDNVTWTQDNDVLTISGEGYMNNYTVIPTPSSPWSFTSINTIRIEDGVYSIGRCAFGWMFQLKTVEIPESVIYIGSDAFSNSRMIRDVYYAGTEADWNNIQIASGNSTLTNANIHYNSTGPVNVGETQYVRFEQMYEDSQEYAIITGVDANGNIVWTHTSDRYAATELSRTSELGTYDTMYVYNAGGTITALDRKTGNILWENEDFAGASANACFDTNGTIYACGAYGPHFFAVNRQGKTLCRIQSFHEDYYWPTRIAMRDKTTVSVTVTNPDNTEAVFCVDTNDFSYTLDNGDKYKVCTGSGDIKFDFSLEECMNKTASTQYNPQLSHMLIAMSNAVHDADNMKRTFESFGFTKIERFPKTFITYSIAVKENNGQKLVLVVVRGTLDWDHDRYGWYSNILDSSANKKHQHSGFSDAADEIYKSITTDMGITDFSNARFVITGHSRGGAAANILASQLTDEMGNTKNVFGYTFACPDTAVITNATAEKYPNIFNINNINDPVSWLPGSIWTSSGEWDGHGKNTYWNKYGKSYWFFDSESEIMDRPQSIAEIAFMLDRLGSIHPQNFYLDFLSTPLIPDATPPILPNLTSKMFFSREEAERLTGLSYSGRKSESEKIRGQIEREKKERKEIWETINGGISEGVLSPDLVVQMSSILCPVDVEVYNSANQLVGKVANNVVSAVVQDKVYISVVEDDKFIYFLDNDNYTLKMRGTDTGNMTYSIQGVDLKTGEVVSGQTFEDVALTPDKQFTSEVKVENAAASSVEPEEVKLYVLDDSGQPEKEVFPDGRETQRLTLPTVEKIPAAGTSYARTQTVKLDGKDVSFQCYAVKNAAGNETNYVKVRDLANALNGTNAQFDVGWDQASKTISIIPNTAYKVAGGEGTTPYSGNQTYKAVSDIPVSFNGNSVKLTSFQITYQGNGYTYYKLRDLGQLLDFNVGWTAEKGLFVETDKPYDPSN